MKVRKGGRRNEGSLVLASPCRGSAVRGRHPLSGLVGLGSITLVGCGGVCGRRRLVVAVRTTIVGRRAACTPVGRRRWVEHLGPQALGFSESWVEVDFRVLFGVWA
ncbi:hypothetical protein NL676_025217 [Syzygium grande]|nr:hypothetical protein NL676_025217 [Syzygium grande]